MEIRSEPGHRVFLEEGCALAAALGATTVEVNSFHHQAIKDVAPALKVVGRASDGIVEAVESTDGLIWGVQWHPEGMALRFPQQQALFNAFVSAVRRYKK